MARPPGADLLLLLIGIGAVSTAAPLIAAAAAPALAIAFWRNALGSAVVVPAALLRRRRELALLTRRERLLAFAAGVLLAVHFGTWIPALEFTTVATTAALTSTQPVWTALLARIRGQQVSVRAWAGIGLALVGVGMLGGADLAVAGPALIGDVLALAGGIAGAGYVTLGGQVRQSVSTTGYTAICYSLAAVLLLLVCVALGQQLTGYPATAWLMILAVTGGAQLLGHSIFNRVLASTGATMVSLAMLLEVPGAALIAAAWLGQVPSLSTLSAILILLAGVALVVTTR